MSSENSKFDQESRVEDGIVIWEVNGALRQDNIGDLKKKLGKLLHEGHHYFIFDFEGLNALDSQGIGFFISALREIRTRNGRMVLIRVDAKFAALFELTLLNRVFEMFTDLETAKKSFGPVKDKEPV
ncbi:MAG: STAS domain-containing protein [Candidatus Omnitrophica bacterium]|nr:STAS domain-containing protein [Candidatus Omnitrophota bacterium]MCB9782622.1 STAS domain-containing protein [Candidatus Omnitrophota bacterium]